MPAGDGSGPTGEGPITGRGLGFCMLQMDPREPKMVRGFAGLSGRPVIVSVQNKERKVSKMPAGDGTGPMGMGPMTGRAAGYCTGYPAPGFMNPLPGRGFCRGYGSFGGFRPGRGLGFGFRGGRGGGGYRGLPYAVPEAPYEAGMPPYGGPTPQQETELLKGQAEYFEDALANIKKRIDNIESATEETKSS